MNLEDISDFFDLPVWRVSNGKTWGGFIRNKPQYFIPEQSPEIIFPQLYNNNQLQIIPTPMNKIHRGLIN